MGKQAVGTPVSLGVVTHGNLACAPCVVGSASCPEVKPPHCFRQYRPRCVQSGAGEALEPEPVFTGRMVGNTENGRDGGLLLAIRYSCR